MEERENSIQGATARVAGNPLVLLAAVMTLAYWGLIVFQSVTHYFAIIEYIVGSIGGLLAGLGLLFLFLSGKKPGAGKGALGLIKAGIVFMILFQIVYTICILLTVVISIAQSGGTIDPFFITVGVIEVVGFIFAMIMFGKLKNGVNAFIAGANNNYPKKKVGGGTAAFIMIAGLLLVGRIVFYSYYGYSAGAGVALFAGDINPEFFYMWLDAMSTFPLWPIIINAVGFVALVFVALVIAAIGSELNKARPTGGYMNYNQPSQPAYQQPQSFGMPSQYSQPQAKPQEDVDYEAELTKFKELYEAGLITEEEYEAKRKEILNL